MLRLTQVSKDQMLTGGLEFFHLQTVESIVPTADKDSAKLDHFAQQRVWEKLVEVIRTRSNPVIIGELDEAGFSFAIEHIDTIQVEALQAAIRELGAVAFSHDGAVTKDLSGVVLHKQEGFRLAVSVDTDGDGIVDGSAAEEPAV